MIAVRYHDKVNVLKRFDPICSGPFDRAEWYQLLAGSTKGDPLIAIAEAEDGFMALPLIERNGRIEPLVNWYSFTWRPLAAGSSTKSLAQLLARDLRDRASRVTLWPLPDEDGTASKLEAAFREAGWLVRLEKCDDNHILRLGGRTYDDFLSQRPGPLRTTLKRKAGKIETKIEEQFLEDSWSIYEEIYARSWKPAEGDPQLLKAFAMQEGAAGRIRIGIALHEGQPVAAQFWTVDNGTAWIHKLAHLEEAQSLSPGTTLTAALFEHVIDRDGVSLIDFGTGNDGYKRDWMEEIRPRYRLDCHNPSRLRSWPRIARDALHRLRPGASVATAPK